MHTQSLPGTEYEVPSPICLIFLEILRQSKDYRVNYYCKLQEIHTYQHFQMPKQVHQYLKGHAESF